MKTILKINKLDSSKEEFEVNKASEFIPCKEEIVTIGDTKAIVDEIEHIYDLVIGDVLQDREVIIHATEVYEIN